MSRKVVDIIFGGQFGSEGKGVIVAHIAHRYKAHVRVGAPNAGHSFYHQPTKQVFTMQAIPVGWINPEASLFIGRGGLVNPIILQREIDMIAAIDPTIHERLFIDAYAGVLDPRFHELEGGTKGTMHKRIGSTGEGVGLAREARISRDPTKFQLVYQIAKKYGFCRYIVENVSEILSKYAEYNTRILLEGTQGQGLSLIHGSWPYCTSNDCGPAQMCADVGIPINKVKDIIAVFRSHPIRVAGNSGPLNNEINWDILSTKLRRPVIERTSVTKKIRRIATWDDKIAKQCRILHQPTKIALTFLDYIDSACEGITTISQLTPAARIFIQHVANIMQVPVVFLGVGGKNLNVLNY